MRGRVETLPLVFQYAKAKRLAPWAQGIVRQLGSMLVFENIEDFKEYIHKRGARTPRKKHNPGDTSMKTTFKLNMSADAWRNGSGIILASGRYGTRTKPGASYTVPKALKAVRDTLKAQGRAFTEVCAEDGYITITAE